VIPAGTANDFARAMELPDDIDQAAELAVAGEVTRDLDLGRLGDRPFVNVASAGLPPVAAREAEGMKKALGPFAYAIGAARAGFSADPFACSVRCDGEDIHVGDAWQVTVACSGAFGGGSEVDADPNDGALDVIVIPAGSRAALAWRAYGLRTGRIDRQREVGAHRCAAARIEAPAETELNVDGELTELGAGEFSVTRHAFRLVVG
jgi:diacylglycerol kinase family enzyme